MARKNSLCLLVVVCLSSLMFAGCFDLDRSESDDIAQSQSVMDEQMIVAAELMVVPLKPTFSDLPFAKSIEPKMTDPNELIEIFDDPLSGWKTRFMGPNSNLENVYMMDGCWSGPQNEDCRGNNWDGLWIHDGDGSDRNSYIRFESSFGQTLTEFSIDIGSHLQESSTYLTVYDADMNILLNDNIPSGCSNCSYNNPGANQYASFSVTSTNGIGGFDITGTYVEGNVGIDNVRVVEGEDCERPGPPGSRSYCSPECPCDEGEGDCDDTTEECLPGLLCVHNVGADYGWDPDIDVCEDTCHPTALGTSRYCTEDCPCEEGEGDCDDTTEQCVPGLICKHNVGANYGWDPDIDVCEVP